jgi:hypothetical protein
VPVVGQLPGQSTLNRKWLIQMRWDVAELFVPKAPATAQPCISAKGSRSTSALSSTKPGSHHRNLELSGPSVVPDHSGNLEFGSLQPKHPPFLRFPSASQLEFSPAQYLRTATGKVRRFIPRVGDNFLSPTTLQDRLPGVSLSCFVFISFYSSHLTAPHLDRPEEQPRLLATSEGQKSGIVLGIAWYPRLPSCPTLILAQLLAHVFHHGKLITSQDGQRKEKRPGHGRWSPCQGTA